jgi:hypothetical protein
MYVVFIVSINNCMIWEKIKNRYYRTPAPKLEEPKSEKITVLGMTVELSDIPDLNSCRPVESHPWYDRTIRWLNILKDLAALTISVLTILRFFGKI